MLPFMAFLVTRQVNRSVKLLPTKRAIVRRFFVVHFLLVLQKTRTRAKGTYTLFTGELVRPDSLMSTPVFSGIFSRHESFRANRADEVFGSEVCRRMLAQHRLRFASVRTLLARERLMGFLVLLVKNGSWKVHVAHNAMPWSVRR